jgi:hypothetical protein
MNNKNKTGLMIVVAVAFLAMVLIGQNAVFNGLVVGGGKTTTSTTPNTTTTSTVTATTNAATTPTTPNSCTDTDGGNNPGVQGTVYGIAVGRGYNITDTCLNETSLKEYVCYSAKYSNMVVNCNCVNGACV